MPFSMLMIPICQLQAGETNQKADTDERPNIVWITSEDNSPHWLGCYGNTQVKTPHIDALAKRGIQYQHAYSNAPVCAVARSSMLMGRYASSLGTQNMRSRYPVPKELKSYPQLLSEAGYYTMNRGKTDFNIAGKDSAHWDASNSKANWHTAPKGKPFFYVVNFTTSHESSLFAKKTAMYRDKKFIPQKPRLDPSQAVLPPYLPDTPQLRQDWVTYLDVVSAMDKNVGKVIKEIQSSKHADNTIIFYFSDHGGILPRSKRYLYDTGTRVPMIVFLPKKWQYLSAHKPGSKSDEIVCFVDLGPTVLRLANAKIPESMQGNPFLGGKDGKREVAKPYAYLYGQRFDERNFRFIRGVTDGKFRYIKNFHPHLDRGIHGGYPHGHVGWKSVYELMKKNKLTPPQNAIWKTPQPTEEFYDQAADPWEVKNLATSKEHRKAFERMQTALKQKMMDTRDSGIIPEMMYPEISKSSTVYEYVNASDFPYALALDLAWNAHDAKTLDVNKKYFSHKHPVIRYWAVMQCAILGDKAKANAPELQKLLNDSEPAVRLTAMEAMSKIDPKFDASEKLIELLKKSDNDIVLIKALQLSKDLGIDKKMSKDEWNEICKKGSYANRLKRN